MLRGIGYEDGGNMEGEADSNPDLSVAREIIVGFLVSCAGGCKDH